MLPTAGKGRWGESNVPGPTSDSAPPGTTEIMAVHSAGSRRPRSALPVGLTRPPYPCCTPTSMHGPPPATGGAQGPLGPTTTGLTSIVSGSPGPLGSPPHRLAPAPVFLHRMCPRPSMPVP